MKKRLLTLLLFLGATVAATAQDYNELTDDGVFKPADMREKSRKDTLGNKKKEIPRGLKVWTIDTRYGDRQMQIPDTLSHMFMNTGFTTGLRTEYNTPGNLGNPRINRIFTDRENTDGFIFTAPYDYFMKPFDRFHFTNTYSPITNLSYHTFGNRVNGEDRFIATFAINAGKKIGAGFVFDYLYGRGYYQNQSTSIFNYTFYTSYLGDRYQAHLITSLYHQKQAENGGIADDRYITNPEAFTEDFKANEIPTMLEQNWNRNDRQSVLFNHRYSIGFRRRVPMTEEEIKAKKFAIESKKENRESQELEKAALSARKAGREFDEKEFNRQRASEGRPDDAVIVRETLGNSTVENKRIKVEGKTMADSLLAAEKNLPADSTWTKMEYVPVTSFIHTIRFDNYKRRYTAYQTPADFYAHDYYQLENDTIQDLTKYYRLRNTFAIALLEGFSKWAKTGVKAFVSHELKHYQLPDSTNGTQSYNQNTIYVGGQISKRAGYLLHYNVDGEFGVAGEYAGNILLDAQADLNIPLWGDTVKLDADAFFHHTRPDFYYKHYHARHFRWDNDDLDYTTHTRLQGILSSQKMRMALRVAVDNVKNYTYFATHYDLSDEMTRILNDVSVRQASSNVSLLTVSLSKDFTFGPLNWENVATYQTSSNQDVIAVPALNFYSNLYIKFKIARVLDCSFGGDVRYFTSYRSPLYVPGVGNFSVWEGKEAAPETGNYPLINIYANFHLKHTRFYVMMSHVNEGMGNKNYFLTPHYPMNGRVLRFGLSWNFFN